MLGVATAGSLDLERAMDVPVHVVAAAADRFRAAGASTRLDEFLREQRGGLATPLSPSAFNFHRHTPPLSGIDYADLSPSRSIRMPLASIFADLDAYTAYVDHCMASGCLPDAVRLLHVLRSEFNAVLQRDFGGRKVRFIGDCIHGLLAAGTPFDTDEQATIELAAQCAGALRSSFELCQRIVEHADRLGLAIGFEYGWTPVTRIGIRGDRSVRTASSLASRGSERCQRLCGGDETMIGEVAHAKASVPVRKLFGPTRITAGLSYDDVVTAGTPIAVKLAAVAAPTILSAPAAAAPLSRAYGD
jgi:class 3 adenylate cyclase